MEEYFSDMIPSETVSIVTKSSGCYSLSTRENNCFTGPIEWSKKRSQYVRKLKEGKYPYRLFDLSYIRDEELKYKVKLFCLALDAYLESEHPIQKADEVIEFCADPEGASKLEDFRRAVFLDKIEARLVEEDADIPIYDGEKIKDIGDVFNYNYLINWKIDKDDSKYYFLPVEQDEEILKEFRSTLASFLEEVDCEEVDPEEIILDYKPSGTFTAFDHDLLTLAKARKRYDFYSSIGSTRRCKVQTAPGKIRDTIVLGPEESNTVKLIDLQVRKLLERNKFTTYYPSLEEMRYQLNKKVENSFYFYCRDFKKEGLTKPRNILKIMLEELHNRFPDYKAFQYTSFYDDFTIIDGKEVLRPVRGHGLGMANALTTLMQIIIFIMLNHNVDIEGLDMITLNDDITFFFQSPLEDYEEIWYYISEDIRICKGLGLAYNPKKSFYSKFGGNFCEEYFGFPKFNDKESYKRYWCLKSLTCCNIVHAKLLIASIEDNPYWSQYQDEILTYWGYEFHPKEYLLPVEFGGWTNERAFGYIDMFNNSSETWLLDVSDIIRAVVNTRFPFKRKSNLVKEIYKAQGYNAENIELSDNLMRDIDLIRFSDKRFFSLFNLYKKLRRKNYEKAYKFEDIIDLYYFVVRKGHRVLPPNNYYKSISVREITPGNNIYDFKKPFSLAKEFEIDVNLFYPIKSRLIHSHIRQEVRKKFPERLIKKNVRSSLALKLQNLYFTEGLLSEYINNPQNYIRSYIFFNNIESLNNILIPVPDIKEEGLEEKKSLWGRIIPIEEEIDLLDMKPDTLYLIKYSHPELSIEDVLAFSTMEIFEDEKESSKKSQLSIDDFDDILNTKFPFENEDSDSTLNNGDESTSDSESIRYYDPEFDEEFPEEEKEPSSEDLISSYSEVNSEDDNRKDLLSLDSQREESYESLREDSDEYSQEDFSDSLPSSDSAG